MNWKKSLIFCASFIAFFFAELTINIACGPEQDPYDYYVSFFHNNVQGDDYRPFAFNGMLFLNSEEDVQDEKQLNSLEWAEHLDVKRADVYHILYRTDSATGVKLSRVSTKNFVNLPDSLKRNSFLKALIKNSSALQYYKLSKNIEPMVSRNADSWNPIVRDSVAMIGKAMESLKHADQSQSAFLKLRYAYQSARLFHYANSFEECKKTYLKVIEPIHTKSAVKGWSLALYAGALRNTGQRAESAYQFSKVFANNPERRIMAYRNYWWTDAKLSDVLKFAKNDQEKANIYALNGFRSPDSNIENLKDVYECQASSPLVAALLIREVNKLEQNLLDKDEMAYDYVTALSSNGGWMNYRKDIDSLKAANAKHLNLIRNFSLKLAKEKKYPEADLGYITAAYLSWMEQKEPLALDYLKMVNLANLSERLKDQFRITELLIKTAQLKKGLKFDENDLVQP